MRRILAITISFIFIFTATAAYAAPIGNPSLPTMLKKGIFFKDENSTFGLLVIPEADFTLDRKLDKGKEKHIYSFYGSRAGIVMADRFFVYGLGGAAEAKQKFEVSSGNEIEWKTEMGASWGVGAAILLYQKDITIRDKATLSIGIDGKYRSSDLDVEEVIRNGASNSATASGLKYDYDEMQVAAGISVQFDQFIPYGGVKYADTNGEAAATINGVRYVQDFEPEYNFGVFAGMDIIINDSFAVNVEGRFKDETAVGVSGIVRF
ncbi:hypothetical protein ACFL0T_02455 [Candidatus Omnitrophota bacterium]